MPTPDAPQWPQDREARAWLGRAIGVDPRTLSISRMPGATSSSVYLVRSNADADKPPRVLRVIDNRSWLKEESDLAEREAAALSEAERAGLKAPRLVAFERHDVGFGGPAVLMTWEPGEVLLPKEPTEAWLDQLAASLASIHRHPASGFPWRYRTWTERETAAVPPWTSAPNLWERAIAWAKEDGRGTGQGEPETDWVFLHRDFHPVNALWRAGAVSAVVDWINACRGPASLDVAYCRAELAVMYGVDAADRFLAMYARAAGGFEHDPFWDVDVILGYLPEPAYYGPWKLFGLGPISVDALKRRLDELLQSVFRNIG